MNEEEKKAIKTIEKFRDYYAREDIHKEDFNNNQSYEKALSEIRQLRNNFDKVFNLINKLYKENEELKRKNKTLEELLQGNLYELYKYYKELANTYQGNCISKEKIKNKIEYLKDYIEENSDEQGYWGNINSDIIYGKIEILEESLEESEE